MKTEILFIQGLNKEITFYIGQNKNENFDVIDKGNSVDLWFHAVNESSCHVVAIMPNNIIKKDKKYIIKAGALLCKNNTNKLKTIKNVAFIYTEIKNIEKTIIPGCVTIKNDKKIIII